MNKKLEKVKLELAEADALMSAIESLYLNLSVMPHETERRNKGAYTFYALWDIIKLISSDLDNIDDGHEDVPIYKNEN